MEYIEQRTYKKADFITVLSNGGIDYIVKRGGDPAKIRHIYNGCLISDKDNDAIKKDFKRKENIEDKFLVTYAGILSSMQGIDNILDEAKELRSHDDIVFYIVGDGMIKQHLRDRINKENIFNVNLLPLQPRNEYLNIVNSSDMSIVSLDERMKAPCVPGKLINLFMLNQPILAVVPEDSETAWVVSASKSGILASQGGLKDAILNLKNNKQLLRAMGENGRKFLENNMNLEKNVIIYEEIFNNILK
jgi:Glycosyltransferase